jgi:23S rRNA (adenine2503-C2)-methyltransferase
VQQVMELGPQVNRIVFMGTGEPLHNYDNVLGAIRILRDRRGLAFQTSGVTISTIGIPQRLKALREEHLKINLTISLHATTDTVRRQLIPGSRSHEVQEVINRALAWGERHSRRVTFVYLLLPGVNDSAGDVDRLITWFSNDHARLNLMRWNPVEGGPIFTRVDDRRLRDVRERLVDGGVDTVVRDTQGRDIDAACGQLWLRTPSGEPVSIRGAR